MADHIIEKMASVGVGTGDISEIRTICDGLTDTERSVLDAWHNIGHNITMRAPYQEAADGLTEAYSADDLTVLAAYVAARRSIEEY